MDKNRTTYLFAAMLAASALASCSESDDTVEEFPNWQARNEQFFDSIYNAAKGHIDSGAADWIIYRNYSLQETVGQNSYDNIVVNVVNKGTDSGTPMYTDSVKVHYRARLLPSTSYPEGYVFSQSYYGDYSPTTSTAATLPVKESGLVTEGLSTALQNMHIGDRWTVYVPHQLGYGSSTTVSSSLTLPAYSALTYDVTLVAYYRANADLQSTRSGSRGVWVYE